MAEREFSNQNSISGERPSEAALRHEFPWAKIYSLEYPIKCEALDSVLQQVRNDQPRISSAVGTSLSPDFVGESSAAQEIRSLIDRVAPATANILISGESGTGKEVVARRIHAHSGRSGPFVAINCSAIPDSLLESELFGHVRGAFTGAASDRKGKFELADRGTLFLDEIGDMPLNMQVKLLRVLQERSIERIGGDQSISVDVRLLSATHRDLATMVEEGTFREDLFYRINVFPIEIPPLRERPDDIEPLLNEMIGRVRRQHGVSVRLSDESIELLCMYAWPGNTRELANVVERLAVHKPFGNVVPDDVSRALAADNQAGDNDDGDSSLPESATPPGGKESMDVRAHLGAVERQLIESALQRSDGVVARAAELLGVGRTTLVEKMKRLGL